MPSAAELAMVDRACLLLLKVVKEADDFPDRLRLEPELQLPAAMALDELQVLVAQRLFDWGRD